MDRTTHFTANGRLFNSAWRAAAAVMKYAALLGKPRAMGIFNQEVLHRLNNSGTDFTALVFRHTAKRRTTAP